MTASARPTDAASSRTRSTVVGCGVSNETWLPPSKSIPRLRPLNTIKAIETTSSPVAIENQIRRLPTKSIFCQSGILSALAPMNFGLSNQRKRARTPSSARVASTAVSIESSVPTRSMSANPRTPPVATAKSTNAVIIVTTFASTIVAKPLR